MPESLSYPCPFCAWEVRVGHPCPGCAKKQKKPARPAKKSWEQDNACDGLDLPDDDFDYNELVSREFGHPPHRKLGVKWYWWLLGVALLVLMALFACYGMVA